MFEGRSKWLVSLGLILIIASSPFFFWAWSGYPNPRTTPTMRQVTNIPFSHSTDNSSIETFVIAPKLNPYGPFPTNTVTYSVQGSSITSQTPLNISVTLWIDPIYPIALKYFIDPEFVFIDNSVLWWNGTINTGTTDPKLFFSLVRNDSNGLVYSTELVGRLPTISLIEAGQLTGTVVMLIGSKYNPNSPAWFQGYTLQVRNTTAIYVQSFHDLQLEKQANLLANANLQHNAQIEFAEAETQYNNSVVTSLSLVIVGFMMVDIGISLYDVSEKKNQEKKHDAGYTNSQTNSEEP